MTAKKTAAPTEKAAPSQPWVKPDASAPVADAGKGAPEGPADKASAPTAPHSADTGGNDATPAAKQAEAHANELENKAEGGQLGAPEALVSETEALNAKLAALSDEERADFEEHVRAAAMAKLDQLTKGREARAIEAHLVDDHNHFGTRARAKFQPKED